MLTKSKLGVLKVNSYVLIAIIIIFSLLVFGKNLFQSFQVSSDNFYLRPAFGSLCCERGETRRIPLTSYCEKSLFGLITSCSINYECKGYIDQSGCKIYLKVITSGVFGDVKYKITSMDGRCKSATNQRGECVFTEVYRFFDGMQTNTEKYLVTLAPGDKIEISALINFTGVSEFTPYVLKIHGLGGIYTFNSEGCFVRKTENVNIDLSQIIVSENLQNKNGLYIKPGEYKYVYKDPVPFTECVNYVESFVLASIDATPVLNGKQVICSSGNIYSIGEVKLLSGVTMKIADAIIDTYGPGKPKECCPGMGTNDLICGSDWKWHPKNEYQVQCRVDSECYAGTQFIGGWSIDYSDPNLKTIMRAGCVNNVCKFDKEKVKVECTHNGQCSGDKPMCDVGNTWRCISQSPSIITGEGAVTYQKLNIFNYIFAILGGLIAFLLLLKRRKTATDVALAIVIGVFVGVVIYIILDNLWKILVATFILGVAGSVILYFLFGAGIFLAILSTLKSILLKRK